MLEIEVAESTVGRYMVRVPPTTVARLEDFSARSCRWHCIAGSVRRPHDLFQATLWLGDLVPRPHAPSHHQRRFQSDLRVDRRSGDGRASLVRSAASADSRSRRGLRPSLHSSHCQLSEKRGCQANNGQVPFRGEFWTRISEIPLRLHRQELLLAAEGLQLPFFRSPALAEGPM